MFSCKLILTAVMIQTLPVSEMNLFQSSIGDYRQCSRSGGSISRIPCNYTPLGSFSSLYNVIGGYSCPGRAQIIIDDAWSAPQVRNCREMGGKFAKSP